MVSIRKDCIRYIWQQWKPYCNRPNDWGRTKRLNGWRPYTTRILRIIRGICEVSLLCRPNKRCKKGVKNITNPLWGNATSSHILGFRYEWYYSNMVCTIPMKRSTLYRPLWNEWRMTRTLCETITIKAIQLWNSLSPTRCKSKRNVNSTNSWRVLVLSRYEKYSSSPTKLSWRMNWCCKTYV